MTTPPWRTALNRWGDATYQISLLLADDRSAAERITIDVCRRVLATDQIDSATLETRLLQTVLSARRPKQILRRHALEEPLAGIPASERAWLGLWLMLGIGGERLCTLAGVDADTLVTRLSAAIEPLLEQPVASDDQRAAFGTWLAGRLDLAAPVAVYTLDDRQRAIYAAWQFTLEDLRAELRRQLGNVHLPSSCTEAIEDAITKQQQAAGSAWWQRRPVWVGGVVLGAVLWLVYLIAPWQGSTPSRATASATGESPRTSQDVVQRAIDLWDTLPVSGTLHRQVWAMETADSNRELWAANSGVERAAHVTDVWIDAERDNDKPRYRIDVTRGNALVEWHLGNGTDRLDYMIRPVYSPCPWATTGIVDSLNRRFQLSADQQHAVRDARLKQGAYAGGLRALQRALQADDLRSYGVRTEGQQRLMALGFTDRRPPAPRQVLLWFDIETGALRSVQELATDNAQTTARDVWRVQIDQIVTNGVPLNRPSAVNASPINTTLIDPGCPELDANSVVSVRTLITSWLTWQGPTVPATLPPGFDRALLLSSSQGSAGLGIQNLRVVLTGPDTWAQLSLTPSRLSDAPDRTFEYAGWRVSVDSAQTITNAFLCFKPTQPRNDTCQSSLQLTARAMDDDSIKALLDTLVPVSATTWPKLERIFFDRQPLAPDAQSMLEHAAIAAQPNADAVYYSAVETTDLSALDPPQPDSPYAPEPRSVGQRYTERRWISLQGEEVNGYFAAVSDDRGLYNVQVFNQAEIHFFERPLGRSIRQAGPQTLYPWLVPTTLEQQMLGLFLSATDPISLTTRPDAVVLEQSTDARALATDLQPSRSFRIPTLPFGIAIKRLTLDPSSGGVRRLEIFFRNDNGQRGLISDQQVIERNAQATRPESAAIGFDDLPPEVIRLDYTDSPLRRVRIETSLSFSPPSRILVWPASYQERATVGDYRDFPNGIPDTTLEQALNETIIGLPRYGLARDTQVLLPDGSTTIAMLQMPVDLMRYGLHYNWQNLLNGAAGWDAIETFEVTVAGSPRPATLLMSGSTNLLVVEVDDVAICLRASTADVLRGPVAAQLATLRWADR